MAIPLYGYPLEASHEVSYGRRRNGPWRGGRRGSRRGGLGPCRAHKIVLTAQGVKLVGLDDLIIVPHAVATTIRLSALGLHKRLLPENLLYLLSEAGLKLT